MYRRAKYTEYLYVMSCEYCLNVAVIIHTLLFRRNLVNNHRAESFLKNMQF